MDNVITGSNRLTIQQQPERNESTTNNHAIINDINQLCHIVQIEKELTNSLQHVQPYILSSYRTMKHTTPQDDFSRIVETTIPPDVFQLLQECDEQCRISNSSHQIRIRPIPRTMEQVQAILSLGRSYSNRTSAPAGWTSTTPLIHFTTPNPLPHQLRHSALATLQLQRTIDAAAAAAKEQERTTQLKNKRKFEQEAVAKHDANMDNSSSAAAANDATGNQNINVKSSQSTQQVQQLSRPTRPPTAPRTTQISMNLSDDESSDDDDDED